jgi:hypothetical protein
MDGKGFVQKDTCRVKLVGAILLTGLKHFFVSEIYVVLFHACRGPDINLNVKQEAMDDEETKCWTNGTDPEKSKTKQQLDGESLLSHILNEVMVIRSVANIKMYCNLEDLLIFVVTTICFSDTS